MEVTCCDEGTARQQLYSCGGLRKALGVFFDGGMVQQEHTPLLFDNYNYGTVRNMKRSNMENDAVETQEVKAAKYIDSSQEGPLTQPIKQFESRMNPYPSSLRNTNPEFTTIRNDNHSKPPQAFEYNSIKSKFTNSSFQGPADGSTWDWYILADMKVEQKQSNQRNVGMRTIAQIDGDKFQAGWERTPDLHTTSENVMLRRKNSMVQSVTYNKENSYGLSRRGCKPGYKHKWTYSDSLFSVTDSDPIRTSAAVWSETKGSDRWKISVNMQWDAVGQVPQEGSYLLIADQRASKLNKNQYDTSMKGKLWWLGHPNESAEVIQQNKMAILRRMAPEPPMEKPLNFQKKIIL